MAIRALSKVTPEWYVPEEEYDIKKKRGKEVDRKPKEGATRFHLRPLTPPEKEKATEFNGIQFVIPVRNYDMVLRMGVVDWENFIDTNGKPLKFSVHNIQLIPSSLRLELAGEILLRSQLMENEAKNSGSQ